jgi:hypothetical protein
MYSKITRNMALSKIAKETYSPVTYSIYNKKRLNGMASLRTGIVQESKIKIRIRYHTVSTARKGLAGVKSEIY